MSYELDGIMTAMDLHTDNGRYLTCACGWKSTAYQVPKRDNGQPCGEVKHEARFHYDYCLQARAKPPRV